ncbi:hypothetical protein AGABI2DRAFT_189915 [Agaricus bisporus var. bisporus H97]|uniref:hypothetical protein n=1 Tax=Agaricus bisporus var. bisporus (strain H97 / ATCC MYA-4626 / FGSC 10389) TaxID=936046 RepID=UPI00029F6CF1|nr:hypothetical protein AGABI2DRAFT_189915 [Agaricus bisporus var. bisporus H97]EKV51693.1 hypothetical protein AGABI2DRAFT_189915 [Agaricus bisporus var. bisporus H97]
MRNLSIPADAYDSERAEGRFSFPLNFNRSQSIMFAMGDATGVTSGGITDVFTVGSASESSPSCNTTDPGVDFFFSTNSKLIQCKDFEFSLFPNAVQPITILVTVANGESFYLRPPPGDPFVWKANLTSGSSVLFTMTDSRNRVGGTSELNIVGDSDDSSCLRQLSPSAAPTRTPPAPTSTSTPTQTQSDGKRNNIGLIVGASIAGVVAIAIIAVLIYFISKRSSRKGPKAIDLTGGEPDSSTGLLSFGQQQTRNPAMNPFSSSHDSTITPYSIGSPAGASMMGSNSMGNLSAAAGIGAASGVGAVAAQGRQARMIAKHEAIQQDTYQTYLDPYNSPYEQSQSAASSSSAYQTTFNSPSGPSSTSTRKSTMESSAQLTPRRFIVHTDIEDEPIELPPMYSERTHGSQRS